MSKNTGSRRRAMKSQRRKQWEADPHCRYCRKPLTFGAAKTDHVIPLSRGGTNRQDNLVLCCKSCNARKADLLPVELFVWACRIVGAEAARTSEKQPAEGRHGR